MVTTNAPITRVLAASTLVGDKVRNSGGQDLGKIEELMIDISTGEVDYAVMSFGGFLGMGSRLFAVPWHALRVDLDEQQFILDVPKETLDSAEGFDKNNWPDMSDPMFRERIYALYNAPSERTARSSSYVAPADNPVGQGSDGALRGGIGSPGSSDGGLGTKSVEPSPGSGTTTGVR